MNQVENKGRAIALLPIGVFLVIFLGSGIVTGDFYAMPAIVAFLIALAVAFMQNKQLSFAEKLSVISKGVGDENIITMSLIFLCAGGFSGAVTAAGGVECCSCRSFCHRLLYFSFYGNIYGDDCGTRTDCCGNQ